MTLENLELMHAPNAAANMPAMVSGPSAGA